MARFHHQVEALLQSSECSYHFQKSGAHEYWNPSLSWAILRKVIGGTMNNRLLDLLWFVAMVEANPATLLFPPARLLEHHALGTYGDLPPPDTSPSPMLGIIIRRKQEASYPGADH
jgi:hypothetical protein